MDQAVNKIDHHLSALKDRVVLTKEEGEHFVRHFKGVLAGVGELVEAKVKQLVR